MADSMNQTGLIECQPKSRRVNGGGLVTPANCGSANVHTKVFRKVVSERRHVEQSVQLELGEVNKRSERGNRTRGSGGREGWQVRRWIGFGGNGAMSPSAVTNQPGSPSMCKGRPVVCVQCVYVCESRSCVFPWSWRYLGSMLC